MQSMVHVFIGCIENHTSCRIYMCDIVLRQTFFMSHICDIGSERVYLITTKGRMTSSLQQLNVIIVLVYVTCRSCQICYPSQQTIYYVFVKCKPIICLTVHMYRQQSTIITFLVFLLHYEQGSFYIYLYIFQITAFRKSVLLSQYLALLLYGPYFSNSSL